MKTTSELIERVAEYEKVGYSRLEAIEMVKIERIIVFNNQIKNIGDILKSQQNERM